MKTLSTPKNWFSKKAVLAVCLEQSKRLIFKNINKIILFISIVFLFLPGKTYAQSGNCDPTVPFYVCDLTGNPGGTWNSPSFSRNDHCCGVTNPDRCAEFEIILDPSSVGIIFSIVSGAIPPGALFYQIGCGPATQVGTGICLSGVGPHYLTFCKPGNNQNVYAITAIPGPSVPDSTMASLACPATITAVGYNPASIVWTDITGGGIYNSYLSCTTACSTIVVTPQPGHPAYVDYQICGAPLVSGCGPATICDTVRVWMIDDAALSVNPNPAEFCANEGGITLTGNLNNGLAPYTYLWTNGPNGTGAVVDNDSIYYAVTSGTYSFIVRDARYPSCPGTYINVPVINHPNPAVVIDPVCSSVCLGNPVTFNASGALTYNWAPSAGLSSTTGSTVIADPLVTTTYTVIGTDAFGCTGSASAIYTPLALPTIEAGPGDTICYGSSAQLNGSGGLVYNWTPAASLNNPNISNPIASPTSTTTYYLSATAPSGQIINNGDFSSGNMGFSSSYNYSSNLYPEGNYYVGTNPNSYHGDFSACGDHTTGAGNMMIINGASVANVTIWCQSITVSPNTDYQFSTWLASVHPTAPAILQFSVNGVLLGSPFNASSTTCVWQQFFSYWNSGSNTTATICIVNQNTTATGNDFAIDDINFAPLCENTDSVTIVVSNTILTTANTNVTCNGGNNGSASVNAIDGFTPYSYDWSNGDTTNNINNLVAGTYTVTVTENIGCTTTASVVINEPMPLSAAISAQTNVSCFSGSEGTATVTASVGPVPYTYSWSTVPAQTTAIATGLAAGTYTVTVTDANLCTTTATVTITQPAAALSAAITAQTNVLCFGNATGSATVTASNGTPGYTYSWSTNPSQVTPTAIGLPVGSYIVTVTDNNGCSVTTGTTITQPLAPLAASITAQTNVLCFGNSTGSATITATGGTPGYTYSWSTIPPQTSIMATGMPAGNYTVTVTDNNGCSLTNLVVIFQPAILTATVSAMPGALCGYDSVGIVSVVAAGGVAPYSYNWSTGSNLSIINGLSAGTYSVTVTDNNGCSETASGTINLIPTVTPDFPALPSICYGKSAPMLGPISPNGIMGTWTPSYVSNTASGTYTFTPNPGQCANPQTLMVNVFPYTPVNFTAEPREGCVPLHVDFDYINNGAIDTNSLHWNFGNPMTTTDVSDLLSPDYTYTDDGAFVVSLTGVSYNGCQVTGYDTIHVWPTPFADFTTHPEPAETDNPKVEFYDQSIGADSWNWNFGDVASGSNNYSVLQYPTHIYSDSGYFTVRLIVANNHNCLDTAVKVVQIIESFVFFTPNAFTPEGDGNNEGFSGKGVGIDEDDFVMYIYDRWGKLMFKTYDLNAKWDGTDERTGKDCELGVYVWLISLRDKTGLQHTLKGVVTLIR